MLKPIAMQISKTLPTTTITKSSHFVLLFVFVLLTGCAVGPLVNHETARTVGAGQNEFQGGYGAAGYVLKWNHGLNEDWDIGLHWESLSVGLRAKYAFVNQRESGWSGAIAGGIGSSLGGNHYYADIMTSYLSGAWEPYFTFRAVHVTTDPTDFKDANTGEVAFTVNKSEYNYGQIILGNRYWFSKEWNLSVEISTLTSLSSGLTIGSGALVGAALGYRF